MRFGANPSRPSGRSVVDDASTSLSWSGAASASRGSNVAEGKAVSLGYPSGSRAKNAAAASFRPSGDIATSQTTRTMFLPSDLAESAARPFSTSVIASCRPSGPPSRAPCMKIGYSSGRKRGFAVVTRSTSAWSPTTRPSAPCSGKVVRSNAGCSASRTPGDWADELEDLRSEPNSDGP